jgi:hypothetical protein
MEFFAQHAPRSEISFVDGNHDYEFALFDIESSARVTKPKGFIFIDNVAQPGPYYAARRFLSAYPTWFECGDSMQKHRPELPYDRERTGLKNTDLCIIRAPLGMPITDRPLTTGQQRWDGDQFNAIRVQATCRADGHLHAQVILREFGDIPTETIFYGEAKFTEGQSDLVVNLNGAFRPAVSGTRTLEILLAWVSTSAVIELSAQPIAIKT